MKIITRIIIFINAIVLFSLISMNRVSAQVVVPGDEAGLFDDFKFDIFVPANFAEGGIYSLLGYLSSLVFSVLLVVWIVVIIIGVFKIISSQGAEDKIKSGYQEVKNVFIGLTTGLIFFVVLSLIGVFFGFGNVYQWAQNLEMCRATSTIPGVKKNELKFQAKNRLDDDGQTYSDLVCLKELGWVGIESTTPAGSQ
ncbi:hypothetical protein JW796_04680 [Candidatus Dojkabacteria bacterium]|nr:hypothetical protein [Candidatus Dojkabacteria bacterium]